MHLDRLHDLFWGTGVACWLCASVTMLVLLAVLSKWLAITTAWWISLSRFLIRVQLRNYGSLHEFYERSAPSIGWAPPRTRLHAWGREAGFLFAVWWDLALLDEPPTYHMKDGSWWSGVGHWCFARQPQTVVVTDSEGGMYPEPECVDYMEPTAPAGAAPCPQCGRIVCEPNDGSSPLCPSCGMLLARTDDGRWTRSVFDDVDK